MKRIISIALALLLVLVSGLLVVFADDNYADLNVEPLKGSYKRGDTFTIHFSVCDITNPLGISLVEFHVFYDTSALKYVDSKAGEPKAWNYQDEKYAENWLNNDADKGEFIFAAINPAINQGVKEDGELYLDLTFELLSDIDQSQIDIKNIMFTDDNLVDCKLKDKNIQLLFNQTEPSESGEAESAQESAGEASEENIAGDQDPNKTLKIVLIVSAAVLLVAAAVVAFILIKKGKKDSK